MKKKVFMLCLIFYCGFMSNAFSQTEETLPAIKKFSSYEFDSNALLIERVNETPAFVLDFFKELDETDTYKNYKLNEEEAEQVSEFLNMLPEIFKEVMRQKLIGIYFIENFMGGGYTEYVLDEKNNIFTILIINPETLKSGLSEFLTFKENTCFIKNDESITVALDCGDEYTGLLYILLHEAAHIADYINNYTPFVEKSVQKFSNYKQLNFVEGVWLEYDKPENKYDFKGRTDIKFYGLGGGPKINLSEAEYYYDKIFNAPFASLYGSKNWAEDFADYCAFAYMTDNLNLDYSINIYKDGELLKSYDMNDARFDRLNFNELRK